MSHTPASKLFMAVPELVNRCKAGWAQGAVKIRFDIEGRGSNDVHEGWTLFRHLRPRTTREIIDPWGLTEADFIPKAVLK